MLAVSENLQLYPDPVGRLEQGVQAVTEVARGVARSVSTGGATLGQAYCTGVEHVTGKSYQFGDGAKAAASSTLGLVTAGGQAAARAGSAAADSIKQQYEASTGQKYFFWSYVILRS